MFGLLNDAPAWACRRPVGRACPGPPETLLHDLEPVASDSGAAPVVGVAALLAVPDTVGWGHVNECGRCQQLVVACYRGGCGPIGTVVSHLAAHVARIATAKVLVVQSQRLPDEVVTDLEDVLVLMVLRAFATWPSWAPEKLDPASPARFTTFASELFIRKANDELLKLLKARNELAGNTQSWEALIEDTPEQETLPERDEEIARLRVMLGELLVQVDRWVQEADLRPVKGVPVAEIVAAFLHRAFVQGEVPVNVKGLAAELGMSHPSVYRVAERVRALLEARRGDGTNIPGLDAVVAVLSYTFVVEDA